MALFYLDTSAIVKRYRTEVGTELVEALFNERLPTDELTSSFLAVLEVTSVVHRLLTAREIREDIAGRLPEPERLQAVLPSDSRLETLTYLTLT